jgi:hypothetical protein
VGIDLAVEVANGESIGVADGESVVANDGVSVGVANGEPGNAVEGESDRVADAGSAMLQTENEPTRQKVSGTAEKASSLR